MLFCVTTRGRDRIFSNPRDSAIVRMASMRTLLLALTKLNPLVGLVTGILENSGIVLPVVEPPPDVPPVMYPGVSPPTVVGEVPTEDAPPTAVLPSPQPKPS